MNRSHCFSVGSIVLALTMVVSTFDNWVSSENTSTNSTKVTVKSTVENASLSIHESARIVVLGSDGKPLDPQPPLKIDPDKGESGGEHTIEILEGTFPENGKIRITSMNTDSGSPTATWGN